MKHLLVYGGTFDPIHWGHIHVAQKVQQHWHFDQFLFLPCQIPVLKANAHASAKHRVDMIKAVLKEQPLSYHFHLDEREIERNSPSYMVTSLLELRQIYGDECPITLLIGYDSFCELPKWHRWKELLPLTNILIIQRKAFESCIIPEILQILLRKHEVHTPEALLRSSHGFIVRFDAGQYDISSSQIRNRLHAKKRCDHDLPKAVVDYILDNHLYEY